MEAFDNSPEAAKPINPTRGVLVITNDSDDPAMAAGRAAAAEAGARAGVPVILYDRSEETWADSQHPDGPLQADDPRLEDRAHLTSQMAEVKSLGAEALAWVSTLPSISAVETALMETDADVVFVPQAADRKLLERALAGDSVATALREQLERHPKLRSVVVVEVTADGLIAL